MNMNEVKCPTCQGKSTMAGSNNSRPFCSQRCKLIDLGAWAAEDYKIPLSNPQVSEWEEKTSE